MNPLVVYPDDHCLVVDIEANGLLEDATQIWCIVAKELGSNWISFYAPEIEECYEICNKDQTKSFIPDINVMLKFLVRSNYLIFHNGIGFDVPLIQKMYPDFKPKQVEDTFIL